MFIYSLVPWNKVQGVFSDQNSREIMIDHEGSTQSTNDRMSFAFPNENSGKCKDFYKLGEKLGSYVFFLDFDSLSFFTNWLTNKITNKNRGAFSEVVKGTHIETHKSYAIKIVNKEETNAKDMYRELSIMSLFNHTNIVNYKVKISL